MNEAYEALKIDAHQAAQTEIERLNGKGPGIEFISNEPAFNRLSLAELIARPKKPWLIDDVLGEQDISMIFGDPGTGKTFTVIDLIICAVLGQPFAGQFEIARPMAIAYTASEGLGGLPQRFSAVANHYQVTMADVANLHLFLDVPQLFDDKAPTAIQTFAKEWQASELGPLDLLVIDTLHGASWGANENDSKDAGLILRAMKIARDRLGCAVLLVHHANRQGNYRGSSALHGAMDSMFQTKGVSEGVFSLECLKQKDDARFKPLHFRLTPEPYSQSVYAEWVEAKTISLADNRAPQTSKAKADILALLAKQPDINQSAIVDNLTDYGRHTVREALAELQASNEVISYAGPKNSRIYRLSPTGQQDRTTDNSPI